MMKPVTCGAPAWPAESIKTIGFAHHIVGRKTLGAANHALPVRIAGGLMVFTLLGAWR